MFSAGELVKREDGTTEMDSKIIKSSTEQKQFVGINDNLADAFEVATAMGETVEGIIILD